MKKTLAEVGDLKIGGRIINIWFADDTAMKLRGSMPHTRGLSNNPYPNQPNSSYW